MKTKFFFALDLISLHKVLLLEFPTLLLTVKKSFFSSLKDSLALKLFINTILLHCSQIEEFVASMA